MSKKQEALAKLLDKYIQAMKSANKKTSHLHVTADQRSLLESDTYRGYPLKVVEKEYD